MRSILIILLVLCFPFYMYAQEFSVVEVEDLAYHFFNPSPQYAPGMSALVYGPLLRFQRFTML